MLLVKYRCIFYSQKVYRQPYRSLNIIQGDLHFYNARKSLWKYLMMIVKNLLMLL